MSNTDAAPAELGLAPASRASGSGAVQVITSREVPLGGPRAMTVRRTLPQRDRSLIGAWCFVDHYGPAAGRMDVAPHPHSGLQTVSWLFSGEVEHRDSMGNHQLIRPGELNLMTSGRGIVHSEVSVDGSAPLHGVQLWVALPDDDAAGPRGFAHLVTEEVALGDLADAEVTGSGVVRVFLGELAGVRADVPAFTPLVGAELTLESDATLELPVDAAFEHGVLVDAGVLRLDDDAQSNTELAPSQLGYAPPGRESLRLTALGNEPARLILLGGAPFQEDIVMWWNFVGRTHDDIVEARRDWQAQTDRFGEVTGYEGERAWLPAPELPPVRLMPRSPA
jgi:hypothetical protein